MKPFSKQTKQTNFPKESGVVRRTNEALPKTHLSVNIEDMGTKKIKKLSKKWCRICKKHIECEEHGVYYISGFKHPADNSWYYSCGKCVEEGSGAFGSIVHHCGWKLFNMSRDAPEVQTINIDENEIRKSLVKVSGKSVRRKVE